MSQPPTILSKICGTVEIVRGFTYKHNPGNYESRDFFCSQKAECPIEDAERVSELLYEFCRKAVLKSVAAYIKDMEAQKEKRRIA